MRAAVSLALVLVGVTSLATACRDAVRGPPSGAIEPPGQVHDTSYTAGPPRLVILLIVDQLPSWSFARDAQLLSGGMARLLAQGVYFSTGEFPYATTATAPGHATLGTGAAPAQTHILGNQWFVARDGREISATDDPESPVFRVPASRASAEPGGASASQALYTHETASGARIQVDGIAEALRRATGGRGRSVAISIKSRSAVLALGRRPDLAIWYDASQLAMTTSRYYVDALPVWLGELGVARPIAPRLGYVWDPLPGLDHEAITGSLDAASGEGAEYGMGIAFPHELARSRNPAKALQASPLGDELVIETALAAITSIPLGNDDIPDLLALSFSTPDYCGHYWGQESWERLDEFLRLDRALDGFLDELDQRIGPGRYAILLSSDHGATRLVERSLAAGRPAYRVDSSTITEVASRAVQRILGPGQWVLDTSASTVTMSQAFAAVAEARKMSVLDAIAADLAAVPGLGYVAITERIAGRCNERSGLDAFACNSVIPGVSGEVFYAPAPGSLITTPEYHTGTNHGSPNPDDRTVPIVVMAPGWRPTVVDEPVSMLQVAPTLARLLHIPPPDSATAPPLEP